VSNYGIVTKFAKRVISTRSKIRFYHSLNLASIYIMIFDNSDKTVRIVSHR